MKSLEETLENRHEVKIWSFKDDVEVPDLFTSTDISVVISEDKACVIVATINRAKKTVYKITKLYYTWKKRRFWWGWKIKFDGRNIHKIFEGEPLIAEE